MTKNNDLAVPHDKSAENPIGIYVGFNDRHNRYDIQMMIGNFANEIEANRYIEKMTRVLVDAGLMSEMMRVQ